MPKSLKERIKKAAKADRRQMAPWCVIQLEKALDELDREAQDSAPLSMVAEDQGNGGQSHFTHAGGAPGNKYPRGRARKKA